MPEAIRREVRPDLEEMPIDHFLHVPPQEVARRAKAVGVVYWEPADRMPIDLFSIIREAPYCFFAARYLAAIALASTGVELILNKDTHGHLLPIRRKGWATLNNENLTAAHGAGFPITLLLDPDERLDSRHPIRFVDRRNKVADGDVVGIVRTLSDYDPGAQAEALDQVLKAQRFLIDWFNTAPDVRDGLIRGHRWAT